VTDCSVNCKIDKPVGVAGVAAVYIVTMADMAEDPELLIAVTATW